MVARERGEVSRFARAQKRDMPALERPERGAKIARSRQSRGRDVLYRGGAM
jgi:hypothetical protein